MAKCGPIEGGERLNGAATCDEKCVYWRDCQLELSHLERSYFKDYEDYATKEEIRANKYHYNGIDPRAKIWRVRFIKK